MAVTLETSAIYVSGSSPTVTIGGSGTDRLIVVFPAANSGALRTLTDVTLDGVSADFVQDLGIDGGRAINGGMAYFLDSSNPGAGSFTLEPIYSGGRVEDAFIVIELSGVDQTTAISTLVTNAVADLVDGGNIATTLAGQSGEFVLSWAAVADSATGSASGDNTPSSNLTELQDSPNLRTRVSAGNDASAATASEQYDWDISYNGSITADSVVTGAFAVFASGGPPAANDGAAVYHYMRMMGVYS